MSISAGCGCPGSVIGKHVRSARDTMNNTVNARPAIVFPELAIVREGAQSWISADSFERCTESFWTGGFRNSF